MGKKIIRGIVVPVEWDESGRVVNAAISTSDENEYFVDRRSGDLGLLLGHLNADVEIDGHITIKDRIKTIKIENIKINKKWN